MLPPVSVVSAPTGGPNCFRSEKAQARYVALASGACAALSYFFFAVPLAAQTQLRVTGTLTIDASASLQRGGCDVRARLLDDAGHAVSGAQLELKPLAAMGPQNVRECQGHGGDLVRDSAGKYLVRTDDAGALCVHFEQTEARPEFELSFSDPNGLYTAATQHVTGDSATRNVVLAFAPVQTVLALERETQVLSLVTRPEPPIGPDETLETLGISLNLARDGKRAAQLAFGSVEIGSNAELKISSRALGMPGPIELSADFTGSATTRAAHTVAHVTTTAVAVLSLAAPVAASHPESGVQLHVRVTSVVGAVPSGSVEARSGGQALGGARVVNGSADLELQIEEAIARARPIELRYIADAPWWIAGPTLSVEIPIAPPSPWRRIAWVAAVAALGTWLLIGWQRPRRNERARPSLPSREAAQPPIDVLELGAARSGWRGSVVDAHDGAPIANATVLVRLPSFDASGVQRTARTDEAGKFVLEGGDAVGPGAALEVLAPFHTTLAGPMPPPGTVVLRLVSRRRTLLTRFVEWVSREGSWKSRGEATPGELARRSEREDVATWASAVDEAAFGPDPLSEAKEQGVAQREPPHHRKHV
jgi:hypothetical protein